MTPESVPPSEMGTHDHDDELESLREELEAAFPARPVPAEDEHIAAMVAEAHLRADKGDPVVRPASNAIAPIGVSWLPKPRRSRMTDKKMERNWSNRLALKVLAPVVVLFTMLGGVAWAGGLPKPLQKTASSVAGFAGLTIEDGTDEDATEVETPDPAETDAPDTTSDNQDGNNQGEDTQDPTSGDNQDETSGDSNVDENNQGEDTQDSTSGDNQDEGTQDSGSNGGSGDSTSEDSGGSSDNSSDTSGDSSGDSSGSGSGSGDSSGSGSGGDDSQD